MAASSPPRCWTLRVRRPGCPHTFGVGFLVGHNLAVTCAHVVAETLGANRADSLAKSRAKEPPTGTIELAFPFHTQALPVKARVVGWVPVCEDGSTICDDIALLRLEGDVPPIATWPQLRKHSPNDRTPVSVFGYPEGYEGRGIAGIHDVEGQVEGGWWQVASNKGSGIAIDRGCSGSPVWDTNEGGIVGMVVARGKPHDRIGFFIDVAHIADLVERLIKEEGAAGDCGNALTHPVCMLESSQPLFPLHDVPTLPATFQPRPELALLKQALLAVSNTTVAVTGKALGVQGMGGAGKTLLAAAVVRDDDVRRAFPDGVLWITLGQTPELVQLQARVLAMLGIAAAPTTVADGVTRLRAAMASRTVLLVLDDVWDQDHVTAFAVMNSSSRLLTTTRQLDVIRQLGAERIDLAELNDRQALALLLAAANWQEGEPPAEASAIVAETGRLPIAVAMAGSMLRDRPRDRWANVLNSMSIADLEGIRAQFPGSPHPNLLRMIEVSVAHLNDGLRDRYVDLAVLPEDLAIPEATLATWWAVHDMDRFAVQDAIDAIVDHSLARRDVRGRIFLHDLQRDYVVGMAGKDLGWKHRTLVEAYRKVCEGAWHRLTDDGYIFQHLGRHLVAADRVAELQALVLDPRWLQAVISAAGPQSAIADIERLPQPPWYCTLVRDALRQSAHVLASDPAQLPSQLIGRLMAHDQPEIVQFCRSCRANIALPTHVPRTASLAQAGEALMRTLTGHEEGSTSVAVAPDGRRAVSASWDRTLKVWDFQSGQELRELIGHEDGVTSVTVTPDGRRAVSASADRTLKVWDLESGQELWAMKGHGDEVSSVAVTPDGWRAVSASLDFTLKVWDLKSGQELCTLMGHGGAIMSVAVTPDGQHAVSASWDRTLKVWDLKSGQELRRMKGHGGAIFSVAVTPDGLRAVSASWNGTLTVWDLVSGQELRALTGHGGPVTCVAVTPDGRHAVSASADRTLKVWELQFGQELRALTRHRGAVFSVAMTPNGRHAVSASSDRTLKVWDHESGLELRTLTGHEGAVFSVVVTPDGLRAISASADRTLRVWCIESGLELRTLTGHSDGVTSVVVTPDGLRAVSASADRTLKVWDLESGLDLCTLTGHGGVITFVAVTPDGRRAVSTSADRTLKVWDLVSRLEICTLKGHGGAVTSVAVTPDGRRAVSASADDTLKVWDLESGLELFTLKGHGGAVMSVAVTPDGRRAVSASADCTLKAWDLERGTCDATFQADVGLTFCAVVMPSRFICADSTGRIHVLDMIETSVGSRSKDTQSDIKDLPSK